MTQFPIAAKTQLSSSRISNYRFNRLGHLNLTLAILGVWRRKRHSVAILVEHLREATCRKVRLSLCRWMISSEQNPIKSVDGGFLVTYQFLRSILRISRLNHRFHLIIRYDVTMMHSFGENNERHKIKNYLEYPDAIPSSRPIEQSSRFEYRKDHLRSHPLNPASSERSLTGIILKDDRRHRRRQDFVRSAEEGVSLNFVRPSEHSPGWRGRSIRSFSYPQFRSQRGLHTKFNFDRLMPIAEALGI